VFFYEFGYNTFMISTQKKSIFLLLAFLFVNTLPVVHVISANDLLQTIHPNLKRLQAELQAKKLACTKLPAKDLSHRSIQFGYHSKLFFKEDHPHWIEIDLGKEQNINLIALIPAFVRTAIYDNIDYGFPSKFRLEIFNQTHKKLIWQSEHEKPTQPLNGTPYLITCPESLKGRYIRIHILQHWKTMEHWATAFSEVMVLDHHFNLATDCNVLSLNDQDHNLPGWNPKFLTDGHLPLGPPISTFKSPSNGLHLYQNKHKSNGNIFFTIDLKKAYPIERIILYPSRPTDYADAPGSGFPQKYRIEGDHDSNFSSPVTFYDSFEEDEINPGDNPVTISASNDKVRFLKISAQKLYDRPSTNSMSLAELQVYSDGHNIALGKEILSPYTSSFRKFPRWYPEALVDGYNSQFKILPLHEWLKGLDQRHLLESEINDLDKLYLQTKSKIKFWWIITILFILSFSLSILLYFYIKTAREKKSIQKHIREQISRDLHDEIGSQLGGIALLSQSYLESDDLSKELKEDLRHISDVAYASGDSMKDIIWLIEKEDRNLVDLLHHFKLISKRILGTLDFKLIEESHDWPNIKVDLQVSRHITLILKEALHNIRKHAKATQVELRLKWHSASEEFEFSIHDNGKGFDPDKVKLGHGLQNFKKRVELLQGYSHLKSNPQQGTILTFKVKLK